MARHFLTVYLEAVYLRAPKGAKVCFALIEVQGQGRRGASLWPTPSASPAGSLVRGGRRGRRGRRVKSHFPPYSRVFGRPDENKPLFSP